MNTISTALSLPPLPDEGREVSNHQGTRFGEKWNVRLVPRYVSPQDQRGRFETPPLILGDPLGMTSGGKGNARNKTCYH